MKRALTAAIGVVLAVLLAAASELDHADQQSSQPPAQPVVITVEHVLRFNWWCAVYPPLCINPRGGVVQPADAGIAGAGSAGAGGDQVEVRSALWDWWKRRLSTAG